MSVCKNVQSFGGKLQSIYQSEPNRLGKCCYDICMRYVRLDPLQAYNSSGKWRPRNSSLKNRPPPILNLNKKINFLN